MPLIRRALTLFELIIVIITLGILAAVVVFSIGGITAPRTIHTVVGDSPTSLLARAHLVTDAAALIAQDQPSPSIAPVLLNAEPQLLATTPVASITLSSEKANIDYFTLSIVTPTQGAGDVCVAASKTSSAFTITLHACSV